MSGCKRDLVVGDQSVPQRFSCDDCDWLEASAQPRMGGQRTFPRPLTGRQEGFALNQLLVEVALGIS